MSLNFKLPPKSKTALTPCSELCKMFSDLIGQSFELTGKPRTDGANIRKLISEKLSRGSFVETAEKGTFELLQKKGVPKILAELLDTFIVTSGESYNLQIWNRVPGSGSKILSYADGGDLSVDDVRYVFVKIDLAKAQIESIILFDSAQLVKKFGGFGAQTIKHQLLISPEKRTKITDSPSKMLFSEDSERIRQTALKRYQKPTSSMKELPKTSEIFSIEILKTQVASKIIGQKLAQTDTKNRGQSLEKLVLRLLGYDDSALFGGYPDIPNQLLEVKVQDAQTIDLGLFSPAVETTFSEMMDATTADVRYLIALTDAKTGIIEGVVLMSGESLVSNFRTVKNTSFNVQKAIKMAFFDAFSGRSVANPA